MSNSVTRINDLDHRASKVSYVFDATGNVFRPTQATDFGGSSYIDFSGSIDTGVGSSFCFNNTYGHSSIGFHLNMPDGGKIQFQGTYDGVNYTPIQMRELSSNGYVQTSLHTEDYLGSISALKKIQFIRTEAGTIPATAVGRTCQDAATLEGIENANPPHRFGNELFHKGFSLTNGSTGNMDIYQPPTGNKFVLTYLSFGVISTAGANVTFHEIHDTGVNQDHWVFSTFVKTSANESQFFNVTFPTPFVASGLNNHLHFTTDASVSMRGVIHGYNTTV